MTYIDIIYIHRLMMVVWMDPFDMVVDSFQLNLQSMREMNIN